MSAAACEADTGLDRPEIGGTAVQVKLLASAMPLVILSVAIMAGCSSGSAGTTSASVPAQPSASPSPVVSIGTGGTDVGTPVAKVEVRDGAFFFHAQGVNPQVSAKVGDVVEWDWAAGAADTHNVTFATPPLMTDNLDPKASSPPQLNAGATWQVRFTRPGTFAFVCTIHSINMLGAVVVS